MTEHDETLSAGELQAALSNAIVRIMRDFYGKGAARSRTTIFDEYVFVVLEDVLTTAEMTLRNGGAGELVRKVRMRFEDVMTRRSSARWSGSRAGRWSPTTARWCWSRPAASRSSCWIPRRRRRRARACRQPVEAGDLQEPGHVGDVDQLPSPGERSAPGERTRSDAAQASRRRGARRHLQRGHAPDQRALRQGGRTDPHLRRRRARLLCHGGGADRRRAHPRRGRRDRARPRAAHAVHADGPPGLRRRGRSAGRAVRCWPWSPSSSSTRTRCSSSSSWATGARPSRRRPRARSPTPTASDRGERRAATAIISCPVAR